LFHVIINIKAFNDLITLFAVAVVIFLRYDLGIKLKRDLLRTKSLEDAEANQTNNEEA